jgi:hypothetical protein
MSQRNSINNYYDHYNHHHCRFRTKRGAPARIGSYPLVSVSGGRACAQGSLAWPPCRAPALVQAGRPVFASSRQPAGRAENRKPAWQVVTYRLALDCGWARAQVLARDSGQLDRLAATAGYPIQAAQVTQARAHLPVGSALAGRQLEHEPPPSACWLPPFFGHCCR